MADQWAWVKIIKCYGPVSGPYGEKEGKAARGMASAADGSAPATLAVTLPADATLTVDDQPMQSSGGYRVFVSPALKPGVTYRYVLKAKAVREGKPMEVTEVVQVYAGRETKATLTFDMPAVAQR